MSSDLLGRNKRSVTIEHSVKFDNGDVIFPQILAARPIQGERTKRNESATRQEIQTNRNSPMKHPKPLANNPETLNQPQNNR